MNLGWKVVFTLSCISIELNIHLKVEKMHFSTFFLIDSWREETHFKSDSDSFMGNCEKMYETQRRKIRGHVQINIDKHESVVTKIYVDSY